ncbi:MAG: hypothetical protein K2H07_05215, partial [Lachnospiraceae bacterium]|nr:hypothetical protein [Lachnospiraceae bacterium]
NAISYLSNILKVKGIEQFTPVFTTPLGFAYHIGDTLSSKAAERQDVPMVIVRVDEDDVWYTLPSDPQQEAIKVDRNSFERYLDTGYFSVKENTPEVVLATAKAENLLPTEQTVAAIKAENPNATLFYQVGDFYEFYGNDAAYMSDTFALNLTNKTVDGERVSMCGIPSSQLETYVKTIVIEARTMVDIISKDLLPAINSFAATTAREAAETKAYLPNISCTAQDALIRRLTSDYTDMTNLIDKLKHELTQLGGISSMQGAADYCRDKIIVTMNEIRTIADDAEAAIPNDFLPYPTYEELLFYL